MKLSIFVVSAIASTIASTQPLDYNPVFYDNAYSFNLKNEDHMASTGFAGSDSGGGAAGYQAASCMVDTIWPSNIWYDVKFPGAGCAWTHKPKLVPLPHAPLPEYLVAVFKLDHGYQQTWVESENMWDPNLEHSGEGRHKLELTSRGYPYDEQLVNLFSSPPPRSVQLGVLLPRKVKMLFMRDVWSNEYFPVANQGTTSLHRWAFLWSLYELELSMPFRSAALGGYNLYSFQWRVINIQPAPGRVPLNLSFQGFGAGATRFLEGSVEVRSQNGDLVSEQSFFQEPGDSGTMLGADFAAGTYDLYISAPGHLRKKVEDVPISMTSSAVNVSLLAGDVNSDNEVGPADFTIYAAHLGSMEDDDLWVTEEKFAGVHCDLNHDGEVGPADYTLIATNFGQSGD